jgi:MFS family permease
VPGLIGPAIAGLMAQALGWRAVFIVLAPLPILAALLAIPALRRIPIGTPHPAARARVLNAIALAAGTGLLLAGVGAGNLTLTIPLLAVGLALAIPAMRHLLPAGTLRAAAGMPAAVATMALINLAFFGIDAFVPLALVDVRGATLAFASLALTAGTISWSTGSWVQARFAARVPRRTMERIGLSLLAIAFVVTATVLLPQTPLAVGPIGWGISGLGMGLSYITLNLTMLELAPPGQEGNASSSMQLASVLGSGLGTGIGGSLIALVQTQGGPVQHALLIHFALMLGAILVAFVAARGLPATIPGMERQG